ncbi:MAG: hypothetical protein RAP41_05330 [Candidatus Orphnella occulta]|nr:hypothetical protein [Candidatus Orphnella occulta]
MLFGLQGPKIVISTLVVMLLILILLFFGLSTKSDFIFEKNRELIEEVSRLAVKISVLTEKLNADMPVLASAKAELEKTRNKLTQERLKNRQLLQEKEDLEGAVSAHSASVESEAL